MKYENLEPIERDLAEVELHSGDRDRISTALARVALHERDREWVEELLVTFLQHDDAWIRAVSATCVGHVARLHGAIDQSRIRPLLSRLLEDAETADNATDALDDIDIYVR